MIAIDFTELDSVAGAIFGSSQDVYGVIEQNREGPMNIYFLYKCNTLSSHRFFRIDNHESERSRSLPTSNSCKNGWLVPHKLFVI